MNDHSRLEVALQLLLAGLFVEHPTLIKTVNLINLLHESRIYPTKLDEIRQAAKGFGFLHRYYQHINDFDNDFYFRIGLFDSTSLSDEEQEAVENSIRQFLSDTPPITIEINQSDLYFAFTIKRLCLEIQPKLFQFQTQMCLQVL